MTFAKNSITDHLFNVPFDIFKLIFCFHYIQIEHYVIR